MLTALELIRSGFEAASLALGSAFLFNAPRGDGHSVMVLPGFATDDGATLILRTYIGALGYDVHPWRLGWNLDHRTVGQNGEKVARRIREIAQASGGKISLVGWSLGGVIAREAARRDPADVRQVITLGSPFTGDPRANSVRNLYEKLAGVPVDSPTALRRFARGGQPLTVPSTSIFSRTDGIAPWQNCSGLTDAITENVEVVSSHFGLVANPSVFHIVADRLAQGENQWAPFDRGGPFEFFYPDPC